MTTETTCLSSIWAHRRGHARTYLAMHGRADDYRELKPGRRRLLRRLRRGGPLHRQAHDRAAVPPVQRLSRSTSSTQNLGDILARVRDMPPRRSARAAPSLSLTDKIVTTAGCSVQQGVIAGCSGGTFGNVVEAAHALKGASTGYGEFYAVRLPHEPARCARARRARAASTTSWRPAPSCARRSAARASARETRRPTTALSIRHTTRNFPNREGSKPGQRPAACRRPHGRAFHRRHGRGGRRPHSGHRPSRRDLG